MSLLDRAHALSLDASDPLAGFRERFEMPLRPDGEPVVYLTGNSLGLMPKSAVTFVMRELDDWARLAVDAHFEGRTPWYSYHEVFREPLGRRAPTMHQVGEIPRHRAHMLAKRGEVDGLATLQLAHQERRLEQVERPRSGAQRAQALDRQRICRTSGHRYSGACQTSVR